MLELTFLTLNLPFSTWRSEEKRNLYVRTDTKPVTEEIELHRVHSQKEINNGKHDIEVIASELIWKWDIVFGWIDISSRFLGSHVKEKRTDFLVVWKEIDGFSLSETWRLFDFLSPISLPPLDKTKDYLTFRRVYFHNVSDTV